MRLGKVLVLAHQDDGLGPEALRITAFFIRTVEAQPVADGLGLADVSDPSVGVFLVLAKKDVDAGPYDFRGLCCKFLSLVREAAFSEQVVDFMSAFKGRHFSGEVVLWAVRWYCR